MVVKQCSKLKSRVPILEYWHLSRQNHRLMIHFYTQKESFLANFLLEQRTTKHLYTLFCKHLQYDSIH